MATTTAPTALSPEQADDMIAKSVVLQGRRVFRNVSLHGDDLTLLTDRLGSLDNTSWMGCDLTGTLWPTTLMNVTIVDSDLSRAQFPLTRIEAGNHILIKGTKAVRWGFHEGVVEALHPEDIAMRLDETSFSGSVSGLLIENAYGERTSLSNLTADTSGMRGSFIRDLTAKNFTGEDVAFDRNRLPHSYWSGSIVRGSFARSEMGDSTLAIAADNLDLQAAGLDPVHLEGAHLTRPFFEEARVGHVSFDATTQVVEAQLFDTDPKKFPVQLSHQANTGPDAKVITKQRPSLRRVVAAQQVVGERSVS